MKSLTNSIQSKDISDDKTNHTNTHENFSGNLKDEERTRCEIHSRVMGYIRPVKVDGFNLWNLGKVGEFEERKYFKEP